MAKEQIFVGVDMDAASIRGVRLSFAPNGGKPGKSAWRLLAAAEINADGGDFLDEARAVSALKRLRENLKTRPSDKTSICLSGKQTYSVRMDARKLPDDEMEGMLRLELRKNMPFDPSAATFDYQFMPAPAESGGGEDGAAWGPVTVGAAADSYLNRQADLYGKAGLPPYHANVLPISIANAFWAACGDGAAEPDGAVLILHLGADVCTVAIDGRRAPFFSRTFSFNAAKAAGGSDAQNGEDKSADVSSSVDVLAGEVAKSAAYYRNAYRVGDISSISMLGAYASHPAFDGLAEKTGYPVRVTQTASLVRTEKPLEPGKYDLAIALAMQAA